MSFGIQILDQWARVIFNRFNKSPQLDTQFNELMAKFQHYVKTDLVLFEELATVRQYRSDFQILGTVKIQMYYFMYLDYPGLGARRAGR